MKKIFSSTLTLWAVGSSEMMVAIYRTTRRHIIEDCNFHVALEFLTAATVKSSIVWNIQACNAYNTHKFSLMLPGLQVAKEALPTFQGTSYSLVYCWSFCSSETASGMTCSLPSRLHNPVFLCTHRRENLELNQFGQFNYFTHFGLLSFSKPSHFYIVLGLKQLLQFLLKM
jgi:hypothetical protein